MTEIIRQVGVVKTGVGKATKGMEVEKITIQTFHILPISFLFLFTTKRETIEILI